MKVSKRILSIILALTMLVCSVPVSTFTVFAEEFYDCTITGRIIDDDETGLQNISVMVYDLSEDELVDYYKTNSTGTWSTKECVSGNKYLISYYHRDYELS